MAHAVMVGPVRGTVTLRDGREIDVNDAVVYVETAEDAAEVAHLVSTRYVDEGHPENPDFEYTGSEEENLQTLQALQKQED